MNASPLAMHVMRALFLAVTAASSVCAMDFTPQAVRSVEDGLPLMRTAFKDGNKQIFFELAKGWQMTGGGNQITFHPTEVLDASVRLGNSPVGATVPFHEKGLEAYRTAARGALPKYAKDIKVLSDSPDAYPLDDWTSFETWFSYELQGKQSVCWVLFITMTPSRQICYVVDAAEKDFQSVYATARRMLGSWFEPPPGWPPARD